VFFSLPSYYWTLLWCGQVAAVPSAGTTGFLCGINHESLSGGRWEQHLAFPMVLWSLPFPAPKPRVVLEFSEFSGTGLPFQLGFTFHFLLSRCWCHLSQICFCNLCYIPQPSLNSNRGTDHFWLTVKNQGLWVTQEHQGEGKQRRNTLIHQKMGDFLLVTLHTQQS